MQSNGAPERWTPEMLDRFASTVATAISAGNERIDRIESNLERLEETVSVSNERMNRIESNLERLEETVEDTAAIAQATSRDVAHLVATQDQFNQVLIRLTDLTEGIAALLARTDENFPTVLAKLNRIENKVDRLLENQS
jgi:ABC-type transporter Mla subunit MlaD